MSIIYCEIHSRKWDSDTLEMCPQCDYETAAWSPAETYINNLTWSTDVLLMVGPATPFLNDTEVGLYQKYRCERLNNPTRKHTDCEYFVLDWKHDKFTIPAMIAYADACKKEFPELAKDLLRKIEQNVSFN